MTLRTQILNRLKEEQSWLCGAELERAEWRTRKGGLYKPSTIGRCLRDLAETTERVENKIENRTVFYRYNPSRYEIYDYKVKLQLV